MLSFEILTSENKTTLFEKILFLVPSADAEYLEEIMDSLLSEDDTEYALTADSDCLLIRGFDGGYFFPYPVELCDGADSLLAASHIPAYAVKEEISLVYYDVPREVLEDLRAIFRYANADALDVDGEYFNLEIMSELSLLDKIPEKRCERTSLGPITKADDCLYAMLCKDESTNAYWGYDYSADEPNPDDSYFREMAENELARGAALALAVRVDGKFVGEASLYAFDFHGGCECAVRILPQYRGRGIATDALRMLASLGADMGLLELRATVASANMASCRLFEKAFGKAKKQSDNLIFTMKL